MCITKVKSNEGPPYERVRSSCYKAQTIKVTLLVIGALTFLAGTVMYYMHVNSIATQMLLGAGLMTIGLAGMSFFLKPENFC